MKAPIHGDVFRLKSGGVVVVVGSGIDVDRRNRMIAGARALGVIVRKGDLIRWVAAHEYDSSGRYWPHGPPDPGTRPPRPVNWEIWDLKELVGFVREDGTVERIAPEYLVGWVPARRRDLQLLMRGES